MRIGQTSFIVFISKLLASALGFIATLYFARLLGAEILGYYAVIISVVSWLKLGGNLGVSQAVVKRISEDQEPSEYFAAGFFIILVFLSIISFLVILLNDLVDAYIGINAWQFVILLSITGLLGSLARSGLKGERKVYIAGLLTPTNLLITSILQISLVFIGLKLTGMLVGYLIGELIIGLVGFHFVSVGVQRPKRRHFRSLFDFAKYSWLGGLRARSFNDIDIILLGALVPSSLVGIYSVAWSLSKFLTLFGNAVRATLFPEVSNADESGEIDRITQLTEDSLAFIGLIAIPGLVGGTLLSDRLLRIYGDEFTQGTAVLALLILSALIYSYQHQMLGIIKAVDRPDIAFRISLVFVLSNVILNVVLILSIGWVGAAVATVLSAAVGLVLAFRELRTLVEFDVPTGEIGRQFAAAGLMGVVVFGCRTTIENAELLQHNVLLVLLLVTIGAGTYFVTLLVISRQFRETVVRNAPAPIPFLT